MSSGKWWPFCLGLNVLTICTIQSGAFMDLNCNLFENLHFIFFSTFFRMYMYFVNWITYCIIDIIDSSSNSIWWCIQTHSRFSSFYKSFVHVSLLFQWPLTHWPWGWGVNLLHAKFFSGNINIYLQLISFLHTDMTWIVEILPHVRRELTYSI